MKYLKLVIYIILFSYCNRAKNYHMFGRLFGTGDSSKKSIYDFEKNIYSFKVGKKGFLYMFPQKKSSTYSLSHKDFKEDYSINFFLCYKKENYEINIYFKDILLTTSFKKLIKRFQKALIFKNKDYKFYAFYPSRNMGNAKKEFLGKKDNYKCLQTLVFRNDIVLYCTVPFELKNIKSKN